MVNNVRFLQNATVIKWYTEIYIEISYACTLQTVILLKKILNVSWCKSCIWISAYKNCYTLFYVKLKAFFSTYRSSVLYMYNSNLYYLLLSFIMLKFIPMHSTKSHSVISHTHGMHTYICVCLPSVFAGCENPLTRRHRLPRHRWHQVNCELWTSQAKVCLIFCLCRVKLGRADETDRKREKGRKRDKHTELLCNAYG